MDQDKLRAVVTSADQDVTKDSPAVTAALLATKPHVMPLVHELRNAYPLPDNAQVGRQDRFYRLPNHHRSYCWLAKPDRGDSIFQTEAIVIKGAEPLLPDFEEYVKWLGNQRLRSASLPMAEWIPLVMGTVPGAVTVDEAKKEYRLTLRLHELFLHHYGELAPTAVPLFVHVFG